MCAHVTFDLIVIPKHEYFDHGLSYKASITQDQVEIGLLKIGLLGYNYRVKYL